MNNYLSSTRTVVLGCMSFQLSNYSILNINIPSSLRLGWSLTRFLYQIRFDCKENIYNSIQWHSWTSQISTIHLHLMDSLSSLRKKKKKKAPIVKKWRLDLFVLLVWKFYDSTFYSTLLCCPIMNNDRDELYIYI
jgi:hypothetical protein